MSALRMLGRLVAWIMPNVGGLLLGYWLLSVLAYGIGGAR